jgi:transporter family protein
MIPEWLWYALLAACLYAAHQVFTRLAATGVSEGLGALVVECTAALSIVAYVAWFRYVGRGQERWTWAGLGYAAITGLCVGAGTIAFFLLVQRGGPLTAVPAILAGAAALMTVVGIVVFREPLTWRRALGTALAVGSLLLLRR